MGRVFQGRAGAVVAFALGLIVATAGTATAAKLITGRQIKDGSVAAKDLSKGVQAQLKKAGSAGPAGLPGAKGDPGPTGPVGPSEAFVGTRDENVQVTTASTPGDLVGRLNLPAGAYAITATTTLENTDTGGTTTGICTLTAAGATAIGRGRLAPTPSAGFRENIAVTLAATLAASGSATLQCTTGAGAVSVARDTRITAVKVGSVTSGPLDTT